MTSTRTLSKRGSLRPFACTKAQPVEDVVGLGANTKTVLVFVKERGDGLASVRISARNITPAEFKMIIAEIEQLYFLLPPLLKNIRVRRSSRDNAKEVS